MSKQKNSDLPEIEKPEVTEKPVEQSELEGLTSNSKNIGLEEVVESKPEIAKSVTVANVNRIAKVANVAKAPITGNTKMNVSRFLLYYPQDIYIEAVLKLRYPTKVFTVNRWFEIIEEIIHKPIVS